MGIHNPHPIAQMALNPAANYHVGEVGPCPHEPATRFRMVITLRGTPLEQNRQRLAVSAAVEKALELLPPNSLDMHDTGCGALMTISGDEMGIVMAKIWLSEA